MKTTTNLKQPVNQIFVAVILGVASLTVQAEPVDTEGMFTIFGTQVTQEVDLNIPGYSNATVENNSLGVEWTKYPIPIVGVSTYINFGLDSSYIMGINLVPTYPVNDMISIFGKVGYNYTTLSAADGGSFTYGAGANFDLYDGYGINVQYNQLYSGTNYTIQSMDVGFSIKY